MVENRNTVQKAPHNNIVFTPPFLEWGLNLQPNFQNKGGGVDRTLPFRGGDIFKGGGGGGGALSPKKIKK